MKKLVYLFAAILLISTMTLAQTSTARTHALYKNISSVNELKKFEGVFFIPAKEPFEEGQLVFKVIKGKLIGLSEQRVDPMGGSSKKRIDILTLNSKGEGKCETTNKLYDRNGELLANAKQKKAIKFVSDGVKIGDTFYKKIN